MCYYILPCVNPVLQSTYICIMFSHLCIQRFMSHLYVYMHKLCPVDLILSRLATVYGCISNSKISSNRSRNSRLVALRGEMRRDQARPDHVCYEFKLNT